MIDFHCHLDLYPDPVAVAEACRARKIYVLSVTTTPSAWSGTSALANGSAKINTAIGLHPQVAHERRHELDLFDELISQTRYVGEVGLDGAPEYRAYWDVQCEVFDHILNSCRRAGGRIISIHSRRAAGDVLDKLSAVPDSGVPVLHWFSGSLNELERAAAAGCWFSVGPAMLRGQRGRELAARMPRDRVLTESDGPFTQIAGTALMPWHVEQAAATLGELWMVPIDEVTATLHNNLRRLVTHMK